MLEPNVPEEVMITTSTSSTRRDPADHAGPYQLSAKDEAKYRQMFHMLSIEDGHLSGKRAALLFRKSGLSQETLAKVWALADSDLDGRLSLKEFCGAMHLISCVRKGQPLPQLPPIVSTRKKTPNKTKERPHATTKVAVARGISASSPARSPKRRSRMASLLGSDHSRLVSGHTGICIPNLDALPVNGASVPRRANAQVSDTADESLHGDENGQLAARLVSHNNLPSEPASRLMSRMEETHRRELEKGAITVGALMHDERDVDGRSASATADSLGNNIDSWRRRAPPRQRRPKLRQLNANDVDAVFVKGEKSLNFLRDIQSWHVLAMGLQRLSEKDMARRVPVTLRARRRHTLPLVTQGVLAGEQEFLPGRGRRTSLLVTAYEAAACVLKQRAERGRTRETELEKATATAASKWNIKPLAEHVEGEANDGKFLDGGNLNVAGLPLLDEDIDVIVHLLKSNHNFRKLDLSRCFLSDKHFISLAQALAWNCRVEELCLKECIFTDTRAATLADVLKVNNHIHSIDVRGCQGLEEKGLQNILRAAGKKSNILTVNGMELAALRAEGSDVLDLSGRGLGLIEAIVVADCLRTRADGLRKVVLHNNSLSTEAFTTLMVALRKQSQLRSLDLSHNMVKTQKLLTCYSMDERTLPDVAELLRRNTRLATVKIVGNRISCTEFERFGLDLMRLLSSNNTVTVFDVQDNNVSPKMLTIIGEKLAANRAVRKDMTFVDCLHLKYPRIVPRPVLADPRKLHIENVDVLFMAQEGIAAVRTTVRTEQVSTFTSDGIKPGTPQDFFFVQQFSASATQR